MVYEMGYQVIEYMKLMIMIMTVIMIVISIYYWIDHFNAKDKININKRSADFMEYTEKKCKDYIDGWGDLSPEYALMFNGKWGCGKTYFIKSYIEKYDDVDGPIWYISLFGVKTKQDLDDKVFEVAHPIFTNKKYKKCATLLFSILRGAIKHKCNYDIKEFTDPLEKIAGDKTGVAKDSICKAIVFDDFERMELNINEFFGFVSDLLQSVRVIIIGNEDEIKNKECYNKFKEKIIGEEYYFVPSYDEALSYFFKCESKRKWNVKLKEEFIEWEKEIKRIIKYVNVKNLRILRQTIHNWLEFYHKIPTEYIKNNNYMDRIFEAFFVLTISYKANEANLASEKGDDFYKSIQEIWRTYNEQLGNTKAPIDISESTSTEHVYYQLPCKKDWENILKGNNYLDDVVFQESLKSDYDQYTAIKKEKEDLLNITYNYVTGIYYNSKRDIDLKKNFEIITDRFENGEYKNFSIIQKYIYIYIFLYNQDVLPEKYTDEYLCKMIDTLMLNHMDELDKAKIDVENWKRHYGVGSDMIKTKIIELINSINNESINRPFAEKESFLEMISKPDNAFSYFENYPLLKDIDIQKVMTEFLGEDLTQHENFIKFLNYRYRFGFENVQMDVKYYADIPNVHEIYKYYEKTYKEMKHTFNAKIVIYRLIKDNCQKLIQYVDKQKTKNTISN